MSSTNLNTLPWAHYTYIFNLVWYQLCSNLMVEDIRIIYKPQAGPGPGRKKRPIAVYCYINESWNWLKNLYFYIKVIHYSYFCIFHVHKLLIKNISGHILYRSFPWSNVPLVLLFSKSMQWNIIRNFFNGAFMVLIISRSCSTNDRCHWQSI